MEFTNISSKPFLKWCYYFLTKYRQYIIFSKLSYLYICFFLKNLFIFVIWKCFKFVSFFFSMKHNAFYIQLLYKTKYLVNYIMWGWNLFLMLFINSVSSICLEWPNEKAYINKSITYIRKNKFKSFFKNTIS